MARTANVGRLSVSLDANTIRYINSIKKAQVQTDARLDKMSKSFRKLKSSADGSIGSMVMRLGALGGAYLSLGFALSTFNKQRELLDQLAKTSDALGIQQKKLQALQHVGELNGVTVTQLNTSLQRMQRNLGDAADGTGETAKALHKLGINIGDISKMSPDEQMQKLAESLTQVKLQTDKAKLAQDLFGRNGVRVLKVLDALNKNGLNKTAQALEDMGIALSRVDTQKVEDANDAIFKSQQVLEGLANKVTIALAPKLQEISESFITMSKENKGWGDEMAVAFDIIWRGLQIITGTVRTLWNVVQIAFNGWQTIFNGLRAVGEDWGIDLAELVTNIQYGFTNASHIIGTKWTSLFNTLKVKVYEWAISIGKILGNIPGLGDFGAKMVTASQEAIGVAKNAIAGAGAAQAQIDAEKAARQKVFDDGRVAVQVAFEARQQIINDKMAANAKDLLSAVSLTSSGIYGSDDSSSGGATGGDTGESKDDPEIAAAGDKYKTLLEMYEDYDSRINEIRDVSSEAAGSRLMGDVDQIGAAFGKQLNLQQTYAKATTAINSVLAAVQVWGDPSMSFYEKIPASIAAIAAVSQLAGQFHGGTDAVPESMNNKSFMLKAGERVVQPEANKKLTKFLDSGEGGGSGGGETIINSTIEMGPSLVDEKVFAQALSKQQSNIAGLLRREERKRPNRVKIKNK